MSLRDQLALFGGSPVRRIRLQYSRQAIDESDISAVTEALRSDWLTTGPAVARFEGAFAAAVGAPHSVAVNSGTAALHAAVHAAGIGAGDEVILPAITFAATANAVLYAHGRPVFADVDPGTLLLDARDVAERVSHRTRAVIGVDYAGQPCDYAALRAACPAGVTLIADACHSLGGSRRGLLAGEAADISAFSFHAVKPITTGEGGMAVTASARVADRMRQFRNHGITTDAHQREAAAEWFYEMVELGHNYRLTDFQCALGLSQLGRLPELVVRRQAIAADYARALAQIPGIEPLRVEPDVSHAYHLFVVRIAVGHFDGDRALIFRALRAEGIGVNVHYIPVYLHPYYRRRFGFEPGLCPRSEQAYSEILSLPIFPAMSDRDVSDVISACHKVLEALRLPAGG